MATGSAVPVAILRDGRPSKSAVADFDTLTLPKSGKPDFGGLPPQDEGFQFLHTLKRGGCAFDTSRSAIYTNLFCCKDMNPSNDRLPVHTTRIAPAIMKASKFWVNKGVVRPAGASRGMKLVAAMAV